jgi:Tol biopolymer transport system component
MPLTPGTRLGPYDVTAQIGAGGMGEVYRATDTNLKRSVAIKILPEALATDPERLARFQREAEVLASLNHPNIAHIYGLEKSTSTIALAMELVEGPTLADRIAQGALPVPDALTIAKQIAEALEAAHEQGIVHRDLKPANIKVRDDGTVKVLDFGLAKALQSGGPEGPPYAGSASMSPTITTPAHTMQGVILGTAAYMSPEQARGRAVDKRADVWAFGCVLYEMLSGKPAFEGEDISDTLGNVLKVEPDWGALPAAVPARIRQVLRLCLRKDRKERAGDMQDVRLALYGEFDAAGAGAPVPDVIPRTGRRTWIWAAAALLLGAAGASLAVRQLSPAAEKPLAHFLLNLPDAAPAAPSGTYVAISPDGARVVYRSTVGEDTISSGRLYVREIDRVDATRLDGATAAVAPTFSPDGQWVLYWDALNGTLNKISVHGGPPVVVCTIEGTMTGASWGPGDTIVFATAADSRLMRVREGAGQPEPLTAAEEGQATSPFVLPDGRGALFTLYRNQLPQVAYISFDDRVVTKVLDGGYSPQLSPSGHLVYAAGQTLWAVGFDVPSHQPVGDPAPVVESLRNNLNYGVARAFYGIAANGTLVYASGANSLGKRTLVWVDRSGHQEPIAVPPRAYTYARLSPDGTRVALDSRDEQNDIWTFDLARSAPSRLTFDPGPNRGPVWTPDGQRLAFTASSDGGVETGHWQAADGSGTTERLGPPDQVIVPADFSPDAQELLFVRPLSPPFDIGLLSVATGKVRMLLDTDASETNPALSPDGRWMAYQSDESGRNEVYVRPFPDVNAGKQQASTDGGTRPLWSRNGKELFYYVGGGTGPGTEPTIMTVPVQSVGRGLVLEKPVVAVQGPYAVPVNAGRHYDVSPDGKRFLLLKDVEGAADAGSRMVPIHVVLNWSDNLRRLVPTR